jgi:hypothetical protein
LCKEAGCVVITTRRLVPPSRVLSRFAAAVFVVSFAAVGCGTKTIIQQQGAGSSSSGPGAEATRRESVPCKSGANTYPIDAFDINTDDATGKTCDVGNVLDDDGALTVLSWSGNGTRQVVGHDVTACVAIEFSDGVTIKSLSMKMRAVAAGCGVTCTQGGTNGCGTGWKVSIFAGPTLDKIDFLQELSLTQQDFLEYRVVVYDRFKAKFVAICRDATPATGDSIAIDTVYGFCN